MFGTCSINSLTYTLDSHDMLFQVDTGCLLEGSGLHGGYRDHEKLTNESPQLAGGVDGCVVDGETTKTCQQVIKPRWWW